MYNRRKKAKPHYKKLVSLFHIPHTQKMFFFLNFFFIFCLGRSLLMRSCFYFSYIYIYMLFLVFSLYFFVNNYFYALVISCIYIVLHNSLKMCD